MRNLSFVGWFYFLLYASFAAAAGIWAFVSIEAARTAPEALAAYVWVAVSYGLGWVTYSFVQDKYFGMQR